MRSARPLGLGQVELAVLHRPARELPPLGRPQTRHGGQCRQHRLDDRAPAMDMELRDVFAGRACRSGKPQNEGGIDYRNPPPARFARHLPPRGRNQMAQARHSRLRQRPIGQRPNGCSGLRSRHPDNRNPRAARGGGEGKNRVFAH